jgi:demethoxyubiquinone hydroxylase (CLK1/Coq7/Cat5 family)
MDHAPVDLKKEQRASRARPRYPYSLAARVFFRSMDMLAGKEDTLAKAKLIEALAAIPYRAWENRQYSRMTRHYANAGLVQQADAIMRWGREAQDNEYRHLLVINDKLKQEGARDPMYMTQPLPSLMIASYAVLTWAMARFNIRRAFLFNAEFEDHAEHTYAELVDDHPEWEDQPVTGDAVREYGSFASWADVFRRIGLDERDHMNRSFAFAGRHERVVAYEGMPDDEARPQAA